MKRFKLHIFLLTIICSCCMTSCYKDDSSVAKEMLPDITISGVAEGYTVVSYADNYLDITPVVTTGYRADELTYKWYLIDMAAQYAVQDKEHPYEREFIAEGRSLHYNVKLTPGDYQIVVEVSAANGYTVSQKADLFVTTLFSEGFYVLKETTDGNTDLDLCNPAEDLFLNDVIASVRGTSLDGTPLAVSTTIAQGYIDDATNTLSSSNVLTVTTKTGHISVMRTTDMKEVMNEDNILFTRFDTDETPYKLVQCMWCNILLTNKGVRSQYQSSLEKGESGRYGITNGIPTDRNAAYDPTLNGLFLWDPVAHTIVTCDYNGTCRYGTKEDNNVNNLSLYTCELIGYCDANSKCVYVLRHKTGTIWVMTVESAGASGWKATDLKPIMAFAPNINKSTKFAICGSEATIIYGINDNKLWAYDFENNTEKQLTAEGIEADETITYVSDQYLGYDAESYLIIGTEKDDSYTLRFYRNFGGLPDGAPVKKYSGKGHVRGIRYTTNSTQGFVQPGLMD